MKRLLPLILLAGLLWAHEGEKSCPTCPSRKHSPCGTPYLGIRFGEDETGVIIKEIIKNSPAEKAGILPGDLVLEIAGKPVKDTRAIREILCWKETEERVTIKVLRGSEEKRFELEPERKHTYRMRAKFKGMGFGGFGPTLMIFNFDKVNTVLSRYNFKSQLSKNFFNFSGGGWGQIRKVSIGGFGFGGLQTVASESLVIDANFGVGFFEAGFVPISTKFFNPRILLGIGGGGFTFHLKPNRIPPTSFDSLLKNPNFGAKVTTGGIALAPALSFDFPISSVGLSLKSGYILLPIKSSWKYESGEDLNIGPDFNPSGPYFQLYVFFGGRGS